MGKLDIAKKILDIYEFNEYDISEKTLKNIVEVMAKIEQDFKIKMDYDLFFYKLKHGHFGNIYRNASHIISIFYKYADSIRPKLSI